MRAFIGLLLFFATVARTTPVSAQAPPSPAGRAPQQAQSAGEAPSNAGRNLIGPFDPITYVRIYEETRNGRQLLYPAASNGESTILRADEESKIVIELDEAKLNTNIALNGLFMRAELSRQDASASTANVEILNYSEIAQDPRTQASQAGVALRTANEVKTIVQNLYELTRDLVRVAYQAECTGPPTEGTATPAGCTFAFPADVSETVRNDRVRAYLRAVQPRIVAVADFFTDERNTLVMSVIGERVFDLDHRSVTQMANKLRQDVAAVVAGGEGSAQAAADLHVNVPRLWNDMRQLRLRLQRGNVDAVFNEEWEKNVRPRLVSVLAAGTIDLRKYKAGDGETLTITVQARGAGGEGSGGISRDFQIHIRKLHPRVVTEPSAFYLRRNGEIRNEEGEVVESNFAPAPGMTFGVVFYGRKRVLSALAPGVGMNVSFMNFAANDFDPSIANTEGQVVGGFRSTTGSTIQVGTGVTASLFSNALQFTFGWNLNVGRARSYWGIGFGFLQIGQEIAKVVSK